MIVGGGVGHQKNLHVVIVAVIGFSVVGSTSERDGDGGLKHKWLEVAIVKEVGRRMLWRVLVVNGGSTGNSFGEVGIDGGVVIGSRVVVGYILNKTIVV